MSIFLPSSKNAKGVRRRGGELVYIYFLPDLQSQNRKRERKEKGVFLPQPYTSLSTGEKKCSSTLLVLKERGETSFLPPIFRFKGLGGGGGEEKATSFLPLCNTPGEGGGGRRNSEFLLHHTFGGSGRYRGSG